MIAQATTQWERIAQVVMNELAEVWEQARQGPDGETVEQQVFAWSRRVGRQVLEAALQAKVEQQESAEVICCGRAMHREVRERREALTLLGPVTVRRRYLRCPQCRAHSRPADQWLGWRGGFSFAVAEMVAWECAALPYREALASLRKLAGLELSLDAAESIVARWGKAELPRAPYSEPVPHALVVQIDGAQAHLEEGWKEIKLGAFFDWDCADPAAKPKAVTYTADWETAEEFRETLWAEALARGAFTARAVAVIGDGAPWIWETANTLFPRAVEILDWYHLTEHLWEAAIAVHGEGNEPTQALAKMWETEVWEGRSALVESHLRELVETGQDDSQHTLRRCADYLQTHQARLRYDLFHAAGWPVGSGVVEGGCKHVVGLRFKRQSTRWTKTGARNVLHLRLDRLSKRWEARSQFMRKAA